MSKKFKLSIPGMKCAGFEANQPAADDQELPA